MDRRLKVDKKLFFPSLAILLTVIPKLKLPEEKQADC